MYRLSLQDLTPFIPGLDDDATVEELGDLVMSSTDVDPKIDKLGDHRIA